MSETHFSCDTVDRELWLAVLSSLLCPETDTRNGYVSLFILPILKSDVLMFPDINQRVNRCFDTGKS